MWKSWVNTVVGIWMVISGLIAGLISSGNFIISGIIVTILGFASGGWRGMTIGVLGLWAILSGFLPSLITPVNMLVTGLLVAILAAWKGAVTSRQREPSPIHR